MISPAALIKLEAENAKLRLGFVLLGVNAGAKGLELKKTVGDETFEHFEMFQIRSIKTDKGYKGIPSAIKYKNTLTQTGERLSFIINGQCIHDSIAIDK